MELVAFIRMECGISASTAITASTSMQGDLGIYGDDATDFLLAYAKAFNVDVTQFMAADYFDAEGAGQPLGQLFRWFGATMVRKKELTVGHLQRGIDAKRLDEQIIQGA